MNPSVSLIHITDLHFFSRKFTLSHFFSKRILGYTNWLINRGKRFDFTKKDVFLTHLEKEKPGAVVISGDFTVTSDKKEFEIARRFVDDISSLKIQVYIIPGNHDYYTFKSVRGKLFENIFDKYLLSGEFPISVQLTDGLSIVFLHTVKPNLLSSRGKISRNQIKRLEEIICNSKLPMVVCAHYPVLHKTETYYSNITRRLGNARLLRQVLQRTRVPLLYIAGHVHHYSYTVDNKNSLVTYLTTPPLFYKRERNGGYCKIVFDGEKFDVKCVGLN